MTAKRAWGLAGESGEPSSDELKQLGTTVVEVHRGLQHREGPLSGFTCTVKDNIAVAGLPWTSCSPLFADCIADEDAEAVRLLERAGALVTAKSALHELAFGVTSQNEFTVSCRNPWDPRRIPGGSSGGTATSVAIGQQRLGLGTDTGGSGRIPAALVGVSALRPTTGGLTMIGVRETSRTLDALSPIARTASDIIQMYRVLTGHEEVQPSRLRVKGSRLLLLNWEDSGVQVADDLKETFINACGTLELAGAQIDDVRLGGLEAAAETAGDIIMFEASRLYENDVRDRPERIGSQVLHRLEAGLNIPDSRRQLCDEVQQVWAEQVHSLLLDADAILLPTVPFTAPLAADEDLTDLTRGLSVFTAPWSLAGCPAVSIPCGLTGGGLPVGLQLVGRPGADAEILVLAAAIQAETEWHQARPQFWKESAS